MRERNTLTAAQRQEQHRQKLEQRRKAKEQPAKNYYALQKYATLSYDYGQIDEEYRHTVMDAALEIRGRQKRMMEDVLAIGRRLLEVRAVMPDKFVEWAMEEFGYRRQWAYETINVYERLEDCPIIGQLSDSAARLIAGPGVPNEVIEAVIEETRTRGRALLVSEVRAIKADRMPPKPQRTKQIAPEPDSIEAEYSVIDPPSEDELAAIAIVEAERETEDAERAERDLGRASYERVPDPMSFDDWLATMPADLTLRECAAILELAKTTARRALEIYPLEHPGEPTQELYNAVYGALPTWSNLIRAMEKAAK